MPQAPADRNLLFAVLALQMDFIGRDDLIAALHAWALDKTQSVGEVLRRQGKLAADEHSLLDALLRKHLEKHDDDPERSLAAVPASASVRGALQYLTDADVQASLAHLPCAELTTDYAPAPGQAAQARFQILRPHARGGLGEVFVARDTELKREVALKEMQERHARDPHSRSRFLLEAEVTGGLEHPGIVPVYGLGSHADGRPYYAMRLIRGDSLKDAIARFHQADAGGHAAAEQSLALRGLLGRFVDVCNAVAYAHSRGVLHRDLKPANVMLGPYGETLVVDWGLAKMMDRADPADGEAPLRPGRADDPTKTQAGAALGTPAYMSPEQAAGRVDELGPRSDVYSLGATLFHLLTGRAPFTEGDVGEVLGKVERGDFPPPRQVNRLVSPALEAVCLKAMARRPEGRYATPRALAEEVERWLADEPVAAYREPLEVRLGRWLRRHQTLAVSAGALLLTGVLALAVSTLLIGQAQRATEQALEKEEQARKGRALAQVDALLSADPQAVPALLAGLEATRADVLPRLRDLWARPEQPQERLRRGRVGLALLPVEPERVKDWLAEWMLQAEDPREFLLLRARLRPHQVELRAGLWQSVEGPTVPAETRFRALVALAAFDPADGRWKQHGAGMLEQLLTANPLYLGTWAEALRPVRGALLQPLAEVFRGRKLAEHKQVAATLLADYAADRPDLLANLILDADARQYLALRPGLGARAEAVAARLRAALKQAAPARAADADRERLASRQANAAIALTWFGDHEALWPLLRHQPDPSRCTWITHRLATFRVEPVLLLQRLAVERDARVRQALLLSLGEYPFERLPAGRMDLVLARLVRDYRDDPDPGVHAAIEWLLRQWREDIRLPKLRNHRPKGAPPGTPTWEVNGEGQTLTLIPGPVEFLMGAPASEPDRTPIEALHRRTIPRSFAIGMKEVTVAEFRRFLEANPGIGRAFAQGSEAAVFLKRYSPDEGGPILTVDWFTAAAYCNWLSQREGLPESEWCYPKNVSPIEPEMRMQEGYLRRKGYRLPTEAEWEHACRAGAQTSRFYGRSEALLGKYAWYQANAGDRSHPAGRLRPNDLGLFDVLGNVAEWCQDRNRPYLKGAAEDGEDTGWRDSDKRSLRGAAFADPPMNLRCAQRLANRPYNRAINVGLRVARTYD